MMDDKLKDILSNLNKDVGQDKLLEYISGRMTNEQMHELESAISEDEFNSDAFDGLQEIKNKETLNQLLLQMNTSLHQQLREKRRKKNKGIHFDNNLITAIIIILLTCVVAYFVIKKFTG